ncbi:MAG TPA: NAD(P)H-dependent oxidoreductase [Candidatus Thermoplasmatota archaeon]|nr:NAD(P)H-dependent oxidoreductase [Candidatus Thermoplasmatota archaeon]
MTPDHAVRVVALPGSLREGSHTRMALRIALEGAREAGATTEFLDLRGLPIPFVDGEQEPEDYPEAVQALLRAVQQADGILLGTPEYHGSYSGVLKNALDLMGFDEFEGKMIGLVSVGGGALGGAHALAHLRGVGRALHAWVVPIEASIPRAHTAFNEDGTCKDPRLEARLKAVGRQVAEFSYLHRSSEWRAFLEKWQEAPENPGAIQR